MTSVTASPLEPDDTDDTSVELKLPPPTSSSSSDRTFQPEPSANDDIQQLESSATGTEVQDFGSKIAPSNVERATVDDNSNLEEISAPSMVSKSQRPFSQLGSTIQQSCMVSRNAETTFYTKPSDADFTGSLGSTRG